MGANAQTAVPTFTASQVLTAAEQNNSARTGVPVFASTTTRNAAFGGSNKTLAEGQLCYVEGVGLQTYNAAGAWVTWGTAPSTSAVVQVKSTAKTDTFSTASTTTLTVNGEISGTGSLTIGSAGKTGMVLLSGANTYSSGATTISAGTLKLGAAGVITDSSALTITGTLDLNGYSETVGSIAGAGTITSSSSGTLTLTAGSNNSSTTFSGIIQNGSATSVALTKQGSGTLTLSGPNTYSGGTTLSAGTLYIGVNTVYSSGITSSAIGTGTLTLGSATISSTANTTGGDRTLYNTVAFSSSPTTTIFGDGTYTGILNFQTG
nr:hypothetical protein [Oxalobacteraceae bacterium]